MTFNAMTECYEEITVCGKPALFTSIRIKRDTVPDGLYLWLLQNFHCKTEYRPPDPQHQGRIPYCPYRAGSLVHPFFARNG